MDIDKQKYQTKLKSGVVITAKGCWEWKGLKDGSGYGRICVLDGGKWRVKFTHRVSYHVFTGELIPGLVICHNCNNTSCCNPEHLEQNTYSHNMQMAKKDGIWDPTAGGKKGGKYIRSAETRQKLSASLKRAKAKKKPPA